MELSDPIALLQLSEDARLRRQAAEELGTKTEFSMDELEALAHGFADADKGVRDACAMALMKSLDQQKSEKAFVLASLIGDHNIEVRNLAGDILIKIGQEAAESLVPFLADDDFDVRKFAADIIGLVGTQDHVPLMERLLDDPDVNVRVAGVEALGNLRSQRSAHILFQSYDAEEALRAPILEAVGKIGGFEAQEFLVEKLRSESDIFLQTACIDSLALCAEDPRIAHRLLDMISEAPRGIQGVLLKTIIAIYYRIGEQFTLPIEHRAVAQRALLDDDVDIRTAGLIALGSEYRESDIPSLINEVRQLNPETQQHILYGLIAGSSADVAARFFVSLLGSDRQSLDHAFQILGFLPGMWSSAKQDNAFAIAAELLSEFMAGTGPFSDLIFELIYSIDRPAAIDALRASLSAEDISKVEEALDIATRLGIRDVVRDLATVVRDYPALAEKVEGALQTLA